MKPNSSVYVTTIKEMEAASKVFFDLGIPVFVASWKVLDTDTNEQAGNGYALFYRAPRKSVSEILTQELSKVIDIPVFSS